MSAAATVREVYREAFRRHGRSEAALLWSKNKQHLRFAALTRHIDRDGFSILDYGCGLGDLKPFLASRFANFRYVGVDIVPEFVADNVRFHGGVFRVVEGPEDVAESFDHIVLSGVFNLQYGPDPTAHRCASLSAIEALFAHARVSLAVDFLGTCVDFRRPGAYHHDPGEILAFALERLTRRTTIDHSYLPYEFALTCFKDTEIEPVRSIYARDA